MNILYQRSAYKINDEQENKIHNSLTKLRNTRTFRVTADPDKHSCSTEYNRVSIE